jgi:quercetin dioxygenase-like cupin family protein
MKTIIHENEGQEESLPGRFLKWVANEHILGAKHLSACVIRVPPGEKVRPAHSHPNGEELIHIIKGKGRVLIAGEVGEVGEGSSILFPQGEVHMLHNTGNEEMKVICFFAPATNLDNYKFFEDIDFPDP